MKPMQGIQRVNCAFFDICVDRFNFFLYTCAVCVWTQGTGHTHTLPHQTPPVSNGSPLSRATKTMVEIERAHEQLGSRSFFLGKTLNPFAKATEFVSELVKHTIEDCYGTLYLKCLWLTHTFAISRLVLIIAVLLKKKINVAIIIYYVMLGLLFSF